MRPSPPVRLAVGLIRAYQLVLSPFFGSNCRFLPSCSEYGVEALCRHGLAEGTRLMARRLGRCHPWGGRGYDPVPVERETG